MTEFVADFETSKNIIYKDGGKEMKVYSPYEDDKGNKFLKKEVLKKRIINRDLSSTWVYLWCCSDFNGDVKFGYSIDDFMTHCEKLVEKEKEVRIYFHNLKFDGAFILNYMFDKGYKHLIKVTDYLFNKFYTSMPEKERLKYESYNPDVYRKVEFTKNGYIEKSKCVTDRRMFRVQMNSMGVIYGITLYILNDGQPLKEINFVDSTKLLNFKVAQLGAKFLGRKLEKESYDYDVVRQANSPDSLTGHDFKYVSRDVEIVVESLKKFKNSPVIDGDTSKLTLASIALSDFKRSLIKASGSDDFSKKKEDFIFRHFCPLLSTAQEAFVRRSYKGGFCFVHPKVKNKVNLPIKDSMCVLDVNSLFPYIMKTKPMPFGFPIFLQGKNILTDDSKILPYEKDGKVYDYYFVRVLVSARLKKDRIPSLVFKAADLRSELNNTSDLKTDVWLENTNGEVELILTKDDFELMLEQYDILSLKLLDGYFFEVIDGLFAYYIDKWSKIKIEATKKGDKTLREIAKLFLNSLYGKFGAKTYGVSKLFKKDGPYLSTFSSKEEEQEGVYIPIASAITSGARRKTIEASQRILDYGLKKYGKYLYFYSDTDSIHTGLPLEDCVECLGEEVDVDHTGVFGLWDPEHTDIVKSKFICQKTYLEETKEKEMVSGVAGLSKDIQKLVRWEHFEDGISITGGLKPVQVKGGVVLEDTPFTLKGKE